MTGPVDWLPAPELGHWTEDAACAGLPVELFVDTFAALDSPSQHHRYVTAALEVCGQCPVSDACEEYARSIGAYSVWGGHVFRLGRRIS